MMTKQPSYKTGLPINSLPGWELIPLNCKLPMLKCPGNQVIFSKDKIGNSVRFELSKYKYVKKRLNLMGSCPMQLHI